MKQETRELLDYIILKFDFRQSLGKCTSKVSPSEAQAFNERQDKIQAFLRSIPEIEKHLTEGGYIQDRNGTPICHGDKVKICHPWPNKDGITTEVSQGGSLQWNKNTAQFEVTYKNGEQSVVTAALSIIPPTMLEKA